MAVTPVQTAYPFGLAFYDGLIYWTDRANHSILWANALNGSNRTVLREGTIHSAYALSVFHFSLQASGVDPCARQNGGCSHLCLRNADKRVNYTCACPSSFVLDADGKKCVANCSAWHFRCGMPDERCIPFYWKCGMW